MEQNTTAHFVGKFPEFVDLVFRPVQEFSNEVQDFILRWSELNNDQDRCAQACFNAMEDQFWRRTFVRSIFVSLEASAYGLKRIALLSHRLHQIDFSPADVAILSEEKYTLDDKGETRMKETNFQSFVPNMKFAFKAFAKANGVTFTLDLSQTPLADFEQVRNRLTHPKRLSDLTVSNAELETAVKIVAGFSEQRKKLIEVARGGRPSVRMPVPFKERFRVPTPFIALHPDARVFAFDTWEQAQSYCQSHAVEGAPEKSPVAMDASKG